MDTCAERTDRSTVQREFVPAAYRGFTTKAPRIMMPTDENPDKDTANATPAGSGRKIIMTVDMAESVSMMAKNEANVVKSWRQFIDRARAEIVAAHGGSPHGTRGDGLMVTFNDARHAVEASRHLRRALDEINAIGLQTSSFPCLEFDSGLMVVTG